MGRSRRKGKSWQDRKKTWFSSTNQPPRPDADSVADSPPLATGTKDNVHVKRLTHEEFGRTFTLNESTWQAFGKDFLKNDKPSGVNSGKLRPLRHLPSAVEKLESMKEHKSQEVSGYSETHLPTCVHAIQKCVKKHHKMNKKCKGELITDSNLYQKWGTSAIIQLKCNNCSFVSKKFKLFKEIEHHGRGRRCAEPNRSLAVGLFNTSIAAAGASRLLASMNKPVPCTNSLQKQLNKVGEIMTALNEEDMASQRKQLKDTLVNAGYSSDTPVPVEADRQYNVGLNRGRRKTPYAPATQTRDVMAENLTPDKKILAYNYESKRCKIGEMARAKGLDVTCPGHPGCTATMAYSSNVGDEKRGGRKLASMVINGDEPIAVDKVTTDADGRMAEGISDEMRKHGIHTTHYLDTVHLNRSVAASISGLPILPKVEVSEDQKCSKKTLTNAKHRLADSMAWRAELEVRRARAKYGNHHKKVKKAVAKAIPAVVKCYQGKHKSCKKHSLVCDGINPRYEYLPKFTHGNFRLTTDDSRLLSKSLKKRMGKEALRRTHYGFTTQKAESTNHAFNMTSPKHTMKCSRNGPGRDHSAIHMLNNLVGDSIICKTEACGVPLSPQSPCIPALKHMNHRQLYWSRRMRSKSNRQRCAVLRRRKFELYDQTHNESFYSKSQLDPK